MQERNTEWSRERTEKIMQKNKMKLKKEIKNKTYEDGKKYGAREIFSKNCRVLKETKQRRKNEM